MQNFTDIVASGRGMAEHVPFPRVIVDDAAWQAAGTLLAEGSATLLGLWGAADGVHMALRSNAAGNAIAVLSLAVTDGRFPSIGAHHAPALRLERTVRDLFGYLPEGSPDGRPWLDHGAWDVATPLAAQPGAAAPAADYPFLPVEGEDLHEIPVGPVHAGIIEPGHFRFTCDGETVVRLEERLGYTHKGVESLLAGSDIAHAARLAGRISGDSTVAYASAFARAVEAAAEAEPPPRAVWLRALMAELERVANHVGDFGAVCNDAAFAIIHMHTGMVRERVLRTTFACFGHRMMMDRVIPGGVAVDLDAEGARRITALIAELRPHLGRLVDLYDKTASLQDRTVGTGHVTAELVQRFGAGGHVGRASGRDFDSRRDIPYAPYDRLHFAVPLRSEGDVNARVWIRIEEMRQSFLLIEQILGGLPAGALALPEGALASAAGREGMAFAEAFRGDVLAWVRLDGAGRVARCHLRDASWFQWPLLEAAIEGNIVADFPLCNKSFNCSYSGQDL